MAFANGQARGVGRAMKIDGREIGPDADPLFIAEIGINHGGDLELAKWLATVVITAGARVIKHQTHVVADEMTDAAKLVQPGNATRSIYEIMADCALDEDDERALKVHAAAGLQASKPGPLHGLGDRIERAHRAGERGHRQTATRYRDRITDHHTLSNWAEVNPKTNALTPRRDLSNRPHPLNQSCEHSALPLLNS